jgi:uncharacterized protein (TIGR03437 family)
MIRTVAFVGMLTGASIVAGAQCSVVNSASYQPGLPSGGALATIFCPQLPGKAGLYIAPSSAPPPFALGGLEVLVNRTPAPLLAVYIPSPGNSAPGQVNFQVPLSRSITALGAPDTTELFLDVNPVVSVTMDLRISGSFQAGLGGFFADANGYAIAQHASDNSPVTTASPAHPGETTVVFANDFYQVWPPPPIGIPVPKDIPFQYDPGLPNYYFQFFNLFLQDYPTPSQCVPVSQGQCSIARTPALQILFRGLAANQIGVEEIHFVVPANQAPGDWALFFNRGSCTDGSGLCGGIAVSSAYVKLPVR